MSFGDIFAIVVAPILISAATGYVAKSENKQDLRAAVGFLIGAFLAFWATKTIYGYNDSHHGSNASFLMLIGTIFGVGACYSAGFGLILFFGALSSQSESDKRL